MSADPLLFDDVKEQTQRVLWSLGLNLPINPEGDGTGYVCPAERYLDCIQAAMLMLNLAKGRALDEIPDHIKARGAWLEKGHIGVIEEMAHAEPEVRRVWAVGAVYELVSQLYTALEDEAKPHPRVVLPKLAKQKRGRA